MARYFFDTYDQDELNRDDEGLDCNAKAEIQERAVDALPDMARDALPDGPNHDFRVLVRNESGQVVFQATLFLRSEWFEGGPDR